LEAETKASEEADKGAFTSKEAALSDELKRLTEISGHVPQDMKAAILISLFAGAAALTLKADDPLDFARQKSESESESESDDSNPIQFSAQYRMSLVNQMKSYTFDDFMTEHDKTYEKDTPEYKKRAAIFFRKKAEAIRLAGLPGLTWTPAMNKFLDQTKPEMKARMGYKPVKKSGGVKFARKPLEAIPDSWNSGISLDWRPKMTYSSEFFQDQGACGSCWATATTSAIEAHADVHFGMSVPLSAQELVSCTPNERHCGGSGGCEGATAELALDYLTSHGGIASEDKWMYTSGNGQQGKCMMEKATDPAVLVGGYTSVPSNNLQALMYAASKGPVIVAVDASSWSMYGRGVFNSCKQDAVLNHAVLLVGYGLSGASGYWMIRNSWGSDWGENGHIKLGRSTTATTATFCGMDNHPEEGSACEGDTTPVKVCGMCGILYEPVLPIVTGVNKPSNFDEIIANVKSKRRRFEEKRFARKIKQ